MMEMITEDDDPMRDYKAHITSLSDEDFATEYRQRVDDWMLDTRNCPPYAEEKFDAILAEADIRNFFPF